LHLPILSPTSNAISYKARHLFSPLKHSAL
jgi:hypothetical protein